MRLCTHFFAPKCEYVCVCTFIVVRKYAQKSNSGYAKYPVVVFNFFFAAFFPLKKTYDRKYLINALHHMEVHVVEMHIG